jgi:response regulator RpfG family c-di-GMP phosphodiesterase
MQLAMTKQATITSVLVVDDDPEILAILEERLRMEGFEVEGTTSPTDAIRRLLTRSYSVLMTDIRMEGLGGIELLHFVRVHDQDTTIVMVSGAGDLAQAVAALRQGADDYICKPFKIWDIRDRVATAIGRRHSIRRKLTRADRLEGAPAATPATGGTPLDHLMEVAALTEERFASRKGHGNLVAERSGLLGTKIGCNPEELGRLRTAALLHDIGEIGLTEQEILQGEQLGTEPSRAFRAHAARGAAIVAALGPDYDTVATAIRHHHERFDGSGFPDQLAGARIPLLSRILFLAQAYTNLRDGSGGAGPGHAEAIAALRAHARFFDPSILETLRDSTEDQLAGRSSSPDREQRPGTDAVERSCESGKTQDSPGGVVEG